jgi:hypothetical protein
MAMLTFFMGLRRTGPSTAAILSTFEPVVTTGLAGLTLHEYFTPVQLVGGLLVLSSVAILQCETRTGRISRADKTVRGTVFRPDTVRPHEVAESDSPQVVTAAAAEAATAVNVSVGIRDGRHIS